MCLGGSGSFLQERPWACRDEGQGVAGMGQPLERSEAEPFLPKLDDFKVAHCPVHAGPPMAEKHASEGGLVGP